MRKTALDIIRYINQEIEESHTAPEYILYDMHMMGFKVRTEFGTKFQLHAPKHSVIHAIWKLVKADSIISESLEELDEDDQDVVLDYFHSLEQRLSETLDSMIETAYDTKKSPKQIRFEIYKDFLSEKQVH